ncbi:hypothetical protein BDZ89DRAFT_1055668 [Hymenopellis radicata]|nr:hypothetical protein BDZ89DRAFT_1055668 [Hymenopellis radicata]
MAKKAPKPQQKHKDTRITSFFLATSSSAKNGPPQTRKRKQADVDDDEFEPSAVKKAKKRDPLGGNRGNTPNDASQRVKSRVVDQSAPAPTPPAQKYATPKSNIRPSDTRRFPPSLVIDLTLESQLPESPPPAPPARRPAVVTHAALPTPATPVRRTRTHPDILMSTPSSSPSSSMLESPTRILARRKTLPAMRSPSVVPSSQQTQDDNWPGGYASSPLALPLSARQHEDDTFWTSPLELSPRKFKEHLFKAPYPPSKRMEDLEIVPDSQPPPYEDDEDDTLLDANGTVGDDTTLVHSSPFKAKPQLYKSLQKSQSALATNISEDDGDEPTKTKSFTQDSSQTDSDPGYSQCSFSGHYLDKPLWVPPSATQNSSQTESDPGYSQCSFSGHYLDKPLWVPPDATQSPPQQSTPRKEIRSQSPSGSQEEPDAVKEFLDMFEDGGGSYPPGFTESLR